MVGSVSTGKNYKKLQSINGIMSKENPFVRFLGAGPELRLKVNVVKTTFIIRIELLIFEKVV